MLFERKVKAIRNSSEFVHGVRRAFIHSLALIYFISLGFNVVAVTTLFAISTLIMMVFEFPTSAIADYDSRKKSLLISYLLFFMAFLGIFLSDNFYVLAVFWILGDIAWTFSTGANSAWAIDALNIAKKKSKLIALVSQGFLFEKSGWFVGGIIGFFIVAYNFSFIWLAVSLAYLILFFITWRYMEERNFKPTKTPQNYLGKSISKARESISYILHQDNRALRTLLIAGFVSSFSISVLFVAFPLFLVNILNIGPEFVSGIYALTAVLAIAGPPIAQRVANKKGFRKSLFSLFLLMGLSIILLSLVESLILVIVILALIQIMLSMTDVIEDSALHHEFSSKIRASLGSVNSIGWAIFSSLAIFLSGLSINFFGEVNTMMFSGVVALISATIYFIGLTD